MVGTTKQGVAHRGDPGFYLQSNRAVYDSHEAWKNVDGDCLGDPSPYNRLDI